MMIITMFQRFGPSCCGHWKLINAFLDNSLFEFFKLNEVLDTLHFIFCLDYLYFFLVSVTCSWLMQFYALKA